MCGRRTSISATRYQPAKQSGTVNPDESRTASGQCCRPFWREIHRSDPPLSASRRSSSPHSGSPQIGSSSARHSNRAIRTARADLWGITVDSAGDIKYEAPLVGQFGLNARRPVALSRPCRRAAPPTRSRAVRCAALQWRAWRPIGVGRSFDRFDNRGATQPSIRRSTMCP